VNSNLSRGTLAMLSKSGEVPERCCVSPPQFAERSPSAFLSSSLRQDHKVPGRPQVRRATSLRAGPDFDSARSSRKVGAYEFPEIPPHEDLAITISVIEGPSKGWTYRLSKLCITMGRIGGGADFEFDEPEASDVHCVIAARQGGVRLYVAPAVNNIYVNDQRIYTVELAHMSTFRVGSSLLLVSVLPNQPADIRKSKGAEK
jgi:hypothetical protein